MIITQNFLNTATHHVLHRAVQWQLNSTGPFTTKVQNGRRDHKGNYKNPLSLTQRGGSAMFGTLVATV